VATDWVLIGTEKMQVQHRKLGLGFEEIAYRMARNDGKRVSGRTISRWTRDGHVPRESLHAYCAVTGLDAGQLLADQPSRVPWQRVEDVLVEIQQTQRVLVTLLAEQREIVGRLETVATLLQQPEADWS